MYQNLNSDSIFDYSLKYNPMYVCALVALVLNIANASLNITNYYNEDKTILIAEFRKICEKIGFLTNDFNFQINEYHNKYKTEQGQLEPDGCKNLDCRTGRILTEKGVYVCPFLANDHRGRMGSDFKDFSKKMYLETDFCQTCCKTNGQIFGIDFKLLL